MNFKQFGRTANLFDENASDKSNNCYLRAAGDFVNSQNFDTSGYVDINGQTTITLSGMGTGNEPAYCLYNASKERISGENYANRTSIAITVGNAKYIRFSYRKADVDTTMLNTGSTALPYQPYKDWHDTPHYIHNTSTDTITTLPADLYADGTNATVGLKGNMSQTGTPTPTTPIQPQECGERTGNLLDCQTVTLGKWTNSSGNISDVAYGAISEVIPADTITITCNAEIRPYSYSVVWLQSDNTFISREHKSSASAIAIPQTFTPPVNAEKFYIQVSNGSDVSNPITKEQIISYKIMLNTGSTALPYEPYGYKIPILSANTTTPVYLGEVQSTRRVKKLVLTGEETRWNKSGAYQGSFYLSGVSPEPISLTEQAYCSHAEFTSIATYAQNKFCFNGSPINLNLWIGEPSWTTDDFKAYLAQQYAAGTPVTVWYVLATPQTAVVNEPIRKIGDYADTVSGITIPTIAGADTLSIGTTLQPSEITVNYHGWHPVQSVHERDNSEWQ